ncbi:MAG: FAD-dependent monooxygenase [Anaplasma sp.]
MTSYYDAVILGGGVNGVLAGAGLAQCGISSAIVEQKQDLLGNLENRVFAVSKKSKDIFTHFGVWQPCDAPIKDILIFDGNCSSSVHYNHRTVGEEPMGYIVSGGELSSMLRTKVHKLDKFTSSSYTSVAMRDGFLEVTLSDGKKLTAMLVICAEGKNSKFRAMAAIETLYYDYGQSCITCNVKHSEHHRNIAVEHFFQGGPFAILPMGGGHKSSIVWTEKSEIAALLAKLPPHEFEAELRKKCTEHLGKNVSVDGEVLCYPISMTLAKTQYARRALLVGDAFHCIHPIAGQGLNIGIRDIGATVEILGKYNSLGSDIGQDFVLQEIEDCRFIDNFSMSVATTGTNAIFSSRSTVFKVVRTAIMTAVEMSPLVKKELISHAMGISAMC